MEVDIDNYGWKKLRGVKDINGDASYQFELSFQSHDRCRNITGIDAILRI